MPGEQAFWVIDTSSILQIRRLAHHVPIRRKVYAKLDKFVADGVLVYPIQVLTELERASGSSSLDPDLAYEWAMRNQKHATRHGPQFDKVKEVLSNPQVRRILDADKSGIEEADPYVLGLAMYLKDQGEVTVLTEEKRDRPDKISMNTACGLLHLYCLSLEPFLVQQGIWTSGGLEGEVS